MTSKKLLLKDLAWAITLFLSPVAIVMALREINLSETVVVSLSFLPWIVLAVYLFKVDLADRANQVLEEKKSSI